MALGEGWGFPEGSPEPQNLRAGRDLRLHHATRPWAVPGNFGKGAGRMGSCRGSPLASFFIYEMSLK